MPLRIVNSWEAHTSLLKGQAEELVANPSFPACVTCPLRSACCPYSGPYSGSGIHDISIAFTMSAGIRLQASMTKNWSCKGSLSASQGSRASNARKHSKTYDLTVVWAHLDQAVTPDGQLVHILEDMLQLQHAMVLEWQGILIYLQHVGLIDVGSAHACQKNSSRSEPCKQHPCWPHANSSVCAVCAEGGVARGIAAGHQIASELAEVTLTSEVLHLCCWP